MYVCKERHLLFLLFFVYTFRDVLAKNKMLKNKGIYKRLVMASHTL
jgi:hypothetical protein